ncbi:winged helix-turn-helix transcriptional regulator [Subtercola boreus]|uniref:winged helix-turn-helix transcriptional regulator n=1 Tax=Subtercola boreus TaxID=120213 RepID=UPI001559BFF0
MNPLAVFGISHVRIDILKALISNGEASVADLSDQLGMTRTGLIRHLLLLETQGIAYRRQTTHPRGSGPITYWHADLDEVSILIDSFRTILLEPTWC